MSLFRTPSPAMMMRIMMMMHEFIGLSELWDDDIFVAACVAFVVE